MPKRVLKYYCYLGAGCAGAFNPSSQEARGKQISESLKLASQASKDYTVRPCLKMNKEAKGEDNLEANS